jgi:CCR4-NOT transcription complex subunit 1
MRLPDPFTPNLKIDLLPEINQSPRILTDFTVIIEENNLKKGLDQYLDTQKSPYNNFLKDFPGRLKTKGEYNVPLINAVVFYIGTVTINKTTPMHQGPAMEIYQHLLSELDSEGRFII